MFDIRVRFVTGSPASIRISKSNGNDPGNRRPRKFPKVFALEKVPSITLPVCTRQGFYPLYREPVTFPIGIPIGINPLWNVLSYISSYIVIYQAQYKIGASLSESPKLVIGLPPPF